jgi:hypothetical protein
LVAGAHQAAVADAAELTQALTVARRRITAGSDDGEVSRPARYQGALET